MAIDSAASAWGMSNVSWYVSYLAYSWILICQSNEYHCQVVILDNEANNTTKWEFIYSIWASYHGCFGPVHKRRLCGETEDQHYFTVFAFWQGRCTCIPVQSGHPYLIFTIYMTSVTQDRVLYYDVHQPISQRSPSYHDACLFCCTSILKCPPPNYIPNVLLQTPSFTYEKFIYMQTCWLVLVIYLCWDLDICEELYLCRCLHIHMDWMTNLWIQIVCKHW